MTANTLSHLRNVAIIAHVDHGKTTLVDKLLSQSGTLDSHRDYDERIMDSNDIEKERGITILAKNTAINWQDYRINIVDTPGHADFGGEVERVLSMVDSVVLLVDAVDGPMPQTRFVTKKALERGLRPLVVVNKIDRPGARPDWVIDQTFDLFDNLGATDEQLDFPVIYASALNGYASHDPEATGGEMTPLFEAIVKHAPQPPVDLDGAFRMQISQLDYSSYVGQIGIGRIQRGSIKKNSPITLVDVDGKTRNAKIQQIMGFMGLNRVEVEEAHAGDIVAITGVDDLHISDTLCNPSDVEALPALSVDEPTVTMTFQVNDSPFAGLEGKFVTSRQLKDRLERELLHNVALRVEQQDDPDKFTVSGRGELHLGILIENMRREGFELAISRPQVIVREIDGEQCEPFEAVTIDVPEDFQGAIMEEMGKRKGDLKDMLPDGKGRVRIDYMIPARGLIGFQTDFMTMTSGQGLLFHVFDHYAPSKGGSLGERHNGVLISQDKGKVAGYALMTLQERGKLFVSHGDEVYEGMVIGIHSRDNDLTVNPMKSKQLTNFRASGTDENLQLTPPINVSLEYAMEFINNDELVEVTPTNIRIRKRLLLEHERKKASRSKD